MEEGAEKIKSSGAKVLISAYACEPDRGSEPGVGWNVALAMAKYADVTVLTKANNETVITDALSKISGPKPKFIYYDLPDWVVWFKKKFSLVAVYYILWQIAVRFVFRKRLPEFDLIHHVTFNGFQLPGFWLGVDSAVVLGPLGGGMIYPPNFIDSMTVGKRAEKFRSLTVKFFYFNPMTRILLKSADKVLAANQETADLMEGMMGNSVQVMLETACKIGETQALKVDTREAGNVRVLWVGGLMARKAPQIAIDAVREARKKGAEVTLDIVGSGPLKQELESEGSVSDKDWLVFHGQIPHEKIGEIFSQADLFLFTSLRDTSGNVVLEAMAQHLPIIVPNHQGVAQICSPEHAMMVPIESPEQLLEGFAEALLKLSQDSELRKKMGEQSYKRLQEHWSWDTYSEKMAGIYQDCIDAK